ncbi:DNA polymerase III subunit delta [Clostridium bovifaecis]|uniref:DNA polymerase III subunit delta n=1 Tax=Clostridium bovifaecis TaxID=2184719 RepID=A0A6I6F4V6_9CLOT|nr:DNA polymerase III subunit delta [Clostridium bovifaecis]
MLDYSVLENKLKKDEISNCYIFCGSDEQTIKGTINKIVDKAVSKDFLALNYVELDGLTITMDGIINACETLPFMSERRVVVVYRSNFLKDKMDKSMEKLSREIGDYIKNLPKNCILIMYYIFESDREKESSKLKKLEKQACVVKFSKLKGATLQKKVGDMFREKGKEVSKVDLALFCSLAENNIDIIENEVEKLCSYAEEREITAKDISNLVSGKNDNDVFNLVDFLSQKKPQISLDVLNELLFKGESASGILRMIERQFKLLFDIKLGMDKGKGKDELSRELRVHPYVCEKMMIQSKKFTIMQLEKIIELCLNTEKTLKSSSVDEKTEMELLIINTAII